jgi:hypothetical protein
MKHMLDGCMMKFKQHHFCYSKMLNFTNIKFS